MGLTKCPLACFHSFYQLAGCWHASLFCYEKKRNSVLQLSNCAFYSDSMDGYTRKVNEYFHAAEWVDGRLEAG